MNAGSRGQIAEALRARHDVDLASSPPGTADEPSCRPMRADAVKNRRRILEAAEEVFAAEGVGVPVDVVAERACVGVGTLYRHFPTKEALFEAIVAARLQDLIDAAQDALDAEDASDAFFSFVKGLAANVSTKHDIFDALSAAGVDMKSRCTEQFDELQSRFGRLLDRAVAVGAVRADVTTTDVIGLVAGACHAAEQPGLGLSSWERMVEVVCDGLRPRA